MEPSAYCRSCHCRVLRLTWRSRQHPPVAIGSVLEPKGRFWAGPGGWPASFLSRLRFVDEVGAVEFVDGLDSIGGGLAEVVDQVDHDGGGANREVPGGLAAGVSECVDCGRWDEDGRHAFA